jgi:hypothetical protein
MNATQQSLRLTGPRVHISPIVGGGLLAAVLVIGALAVGRQAPAAAAPQIPFDAVQFRAEEHAAMVPQVPFDWVRFRAEEREAMNPIAPYGDSLYRAQQRSAPAQIPFDAVKFRAEEHAAMNPLAPYGDLLYRAQLAATATADATIDEAESRATRHGTQSSGLGGRGIQAR